MIWWHENPTRARSERLGVAELAERVGWLKGVRWHLSDGAALAGAVEGRRDAVSDVCARWPRYLDAWARLEGDVPHITTWINEQPIADFTDTANHAIGGATDGYIAVQVHRAERWRPAGLWRWRAIAVKELP